MNRLLKTKNSGSLVPGYLLLPGLFCLLMYAAAVEAQALPQTDLWLAELNHGRPGIPAKISTRTGYNNQPHFSEDGAVIFYTREQPGDETSVQTDVAAFRLSTQTTSMINHTPLSEYSPTPIPGRNALSVIQVEPDQKQRLWSIDIANGRMELLLPGIEPVGYHAWINASQVAMFILGDSFSLQVASLGKAEAIIIADNIGRTIRRHPHSGEVLFVDKTPQPWQIAAFDPETGQTRQIMPLFPEIEDFTVDSNGNYWSGNGSKLYRRQPGDSRWELMTNMSAFGVGQITRLAVSPTVNHIVLVGNHIAPD